jgi:hypothetical protein
MEPALDLIPANKKAFEFDNAHRDEPVRYIVVRLEQ